MERPGPIGSSSADVPGSGQSTSGPGKLPVDAPGSTPADPPPGSEDSYTPALTQAAIRFAEAEQARDEIGSLRLSLSLGPSFTLSLGLSLSLSRSLSRSRSLSPEPSPSPSP